jgi:hypothetical protein
MAKNYRARLDFHLQLNLFDPGTLMAWGSLPPDLMITDGVRAFSAEHPLILGRTRIFLSLPWERMQRPDPPPEPTPPQPKRISNPRAFLRRKIFG